MKKIFAAVASMAALLCLSSVPASAKSGLEAGYVNSSYSFKTGISSDNNYSLNGFYVGLSQDVRLFAGLHIVPGIYYTYLTDKNDLVEMYGVEGIEGIFELKNRRNITDHYLNVPIMFRYQFGLPGVKLCIFAGPTLSVGLVSNQKFTVTGDFLGNNINGTLSYNFYTGKVKADDMDVMPDGIVPEYQYNRFDIQLGGGVGIEIMRFLEVKVGYDCGLMNRYKGDAAELYRNQFYAAVGFRF